MKTRLFFVVPVLVALAAAPAFAQIARPERPYRGLFGGGGQGNFEQSLTGSLSFGGGYDDDVLAGESDLTPDAGPAGGRASALGHFSGGLQYSLSRSRVSLGASFAATASYVPILLDPVLPQYGGSVGTTARLTSRTRLGADLGYSYQPLYSLAAFTAPFEPELGATALDPVGLGAQIENHSSTFSTVSLTQDLTSRLSAALNYGLQRSASASGDYDVSTHSVGGSFRIGIARGLGLRLGYARSMSKSPTDGQTYTTESIDAGVDFSRALSLSRRTRLTFSTGLASVSDDTRTQHSAIGSAVLTRELGRSWFAALNYGRDVSFVDTFRQPVFSDAVSVGLGGQLNRRLQLQSSLGASIGTIGLEDVNNGYTSYFGTTGLTVSVTRSVGVGIDYTYYRYQFDSDVELPPGYQQRSDRQSIRAYVSLWVPFFQRAGRPNASR